MPLPAQRLKQLRAILLRSRKDFGRILSPNKTIPAGKSVLASWASMRRDIAKRIRTMRRTGRPDIQLWPLLDSLDAKGRTVDPKIVKRYIVRQLPIPKMDSWKVLEFVRQHARRRSHRKLYRDLKKGRLGND